MSKSPKSLAALKRLAAQPFTVETLPAIMDSLKNESDRAVVIISSSIIEEELGNLIKRIMLQLSNDDEQKIFGFDGPAGTFSNRILLAFTLGLIDTNDRRKLDILRQMRNACAHSRVPLTFSTPELLDVARLLLPKAHRNEIEGAQLRATFILFCSLLLLVLIGGKTNENRQMVLDMVNKRFGKVDPETSVGV